MPSRRSSGGSRSSSSGGGIFGRGTPQPSRQSSTATARAPVRERDNTRSAPPPATTTAHPPAPAQPYAAQPQSGGLLSGIGSTIMQGMAFGGGSAIAHRAVDSVMGPRTVVHEHQGGAEVAGSAASTMSSNSNRSRSCMDEDNQFSQCIKDNNGNVSNCSFLFDVLQQCQKNALQ